MCTVYLGTKFSANEKPLTTSKHICVQVAVMTLTTEEKNQALAGAIPYCGEYPGPRFEDKFRSANQMDGISKAGGDKMAAS